MKMYFVMEFTVLKAEKQFIAKYFESQIHDSSSVARLREGKRDSRERCRGRG